MLIRKQNEERGADREGGHQVWQKRHGVDVVSPFTSPLFGHGVAYHSAYGTGEQGTAHRHEYGALESRPDGLVIEYALLTVHTVFSDVLARSPPLGGEVRGVTGVEEAVVARVRQEGLEGKGDDGEDAREEGQYDKYERYDEAPGLAETDLRALARLARDGGVALAAAQGHLVHEHDDDTEDHHDDGKNTGLAGISGVQGDVLGREGREAQVVRHGVGAHRARKDEQHGREDGGLHHGQRDPEHGFPLRCV